MNPLAVYALTKREIVRFYRQRSRVIGSLATPLVFWLVLGSGFGASFQTVGGGAGHGYLEYFYPGVLAMILLFTAIFSTISIIEDRSQGFLQAVLVAPISRGSIVLGKIFGATALALFQAIIFLALAPLAGVSVGLIEVVSVCAVFLIVGFGLTALGFLIAWKLDSIQGFHSIMNILLLPMWLLSGAAFPSVGSSKWMALIMHVNPMTYGVAAIRRALYWRTSAGWVGIPSMGLSLAVSVLYGIVLFALCFQVVSRRQGQGR
jgi:ABC-2 type transport system permease protein